MGVGAGREVAFTHLLCQELLAKPEVREDNVALGVEQHVLQLQVSVDDAQLAGATRVLRTPPPASPNPAACVPVPGHCAEGDPPDIYLLCRSGRGARRSHWKGKAI